MKYQRTPEGIYKLYSVGWDAEDNGGVPVSKNKPSDIEQEGRNWVWQIPIPAK